MATDKDKAATPPSPSRKMKGWLVNAVVWAAFAVMPFFSFFPGRPIVDGKDYAHFIVMLLSFMTVFYVNWFFLIEKYVFRRKLGMFFLMNVLLIAAMMLAIHVVNQLFFPSPGHLGPHRGSQIMRLLLGNVLIYSLVVAVSLAIKMTSEWYRSENERKDKEKKRTETELLHLKSQLNPHFLFNTLNNIYSLIQIDVDMAQEAVHDLSRLLRYALYDSSKPMVPVDSELSFLRDYIALMKIRMPSHVDLKVDTLPSVPGREMAPMLFISLIENAFKHGVSNTEPSFIDIRIKAEGEEGDPRRLVCDIRNSSFPKTDSDRSGSGIGLSNLRERLEMIYPGDYSFTSEEKDGVYLSRLDIPLKG